MTIDAQLTDLLKEAMRSKDQRTKDVIAMIKTKHMERRTASGFKGALDDSLWLEVIGSYQKQLRKTREEYAALGEKGSEELPKLASDDEVRAAVKLTLAGLDPAAPKNSGRIMGEIMKANKGKFDPAAVKRIVEEELAKG
jgi:hypothetical protein